MFARSERWRKISLKEYISGSRVTAEAKDEADDSRHHRVARMPSHCGSEAVVPPAIDERPPTLTLTHVLPSASSARAASWETLREPGSY